MAKRDEERKYNNPMVNGSAAYDVNRFQESTARPLPQEEPQRAPQRQPRKEHQALPRQKMAVAPFAVVGVVVALVMMILVVFSYVQVYESANRVDDLKDQVAELTAENHRLHSKYDSSINLEVVEQRARELGMKQPSSKQIMTVNIPAEDTTIITKESGSNLLVDAWDALVDTAKGLMEYLTAG